MEAEGMCRMRKVAEFRKSMILMGEGMVKSKFQ